jgi:hypothetical protein
MMKNKGEFERLCKIYPLFKLSIKEIEGKDHLTADINDGSSFNCYLTELGGLTRESQLTLDRDHMQESLRVELMLQYPDLYISVYANRKGLVASAWVKRNNKDDEAIGDIDILSMDFRDTMAKWQEEAEKSKQDGWFFCSGHQKAEPLGDDGYFHFAGRYCKKYGDEHPESRSAAMKENYR